MGKIARIVVALGLVAGATLAGASPAYATACNDSDKDVHVGEPQVAFVGVDGDLVKGVCVRVAGVGADAHVPIFIWQVTPSAVGAAGIRACVVAPGGDTCLWPGASVNVSTTFLQVSGGAVVCGDVPVCVTVGAGNFTHPWFTVCLLTPGSIRCVTEPDPA
jgi:hypothetical protein